MSLWDSVKKFTQPFAEDDEYDDYDDEYEEGDYEEEERPVQRTRRSVQEPAPRAAASPAGFGTPAPGAGFGTAAATAAPANTGFSGRVVSAPASSPNADLLQKIVLARPAKYEDATVSARNLRENKAVLLNLENVDKALARRVVDFLSGSTYVLDGSVRKVAQYIYLFVPRNMEILGDLESLQSDLESYV